MSSIQSAERVSHQDASDNFVFQRSLLAYHHAAEIIHGDVLEIGTGSGYGISLLAQKADNFVSIDKFAGSINLDPMPNVQLMQMTVPPLKGIADSSFDFVVTFQVIEHIKKDREMVSEIERVLRPGGRLIISTPNRKMSLTRNPWHVREYGVEEFGSLLGEFFQSVEPFGVFGQENVMEYYRANQLSVARVARFDPLGMRNWLPRWALRIPYDLLNRMNRRKLLKQNSELTSQIKMEDYYIAPANESCFDLFYIAHKTGC